MYVIILWIINRPINVTIIWITISADISKLPFLSSYSGTYLPIDLFKSTIGIIASNAYWIMFKISDFESSSKLKTCLKKLFESSELSIWFIIRN